MTDLEFDKEIRKVKGCFSALTDAKILIVHEKLSFMSGKDFSRLCDKIITTKVTTPTVADFIAEANNYKKSIIRNDSEVPYSMFTYAQTISLFAILKGAATGKFKGDLDLITGSLIGIIKKGDKKQAHNLFLELSEKYKIPYPHDSSGKTF